MEAENKRGILHKVAKKNDEDFKHQSDLMLTISTADTRDRENVT